MSQFFFYCYCLDDTTKEKRGHGKVNTKQIRDEYVVFYMISCFTLCILYLCSVHFDIIFCFYHLSLFCYMLCPFIYYIMYL